MHKVIKVKINQISLIIYIKDKNNYRVNNELSKVYTKNKSPLIWNIPIISEAAVFEFQFHNSSKIPISWALKYNKCITCAKENNNNTKYNSMNKNYGTFSNKCVHSKSIQIFPSVNLKVIQNTMN